MTHASAEMLTIIGWILSSMGSWVGACAVVLAGFAYYHEDATLTMLVAVVVSWLVALAGVIALWGHQPV